MAVIVAAISCSVFAEMDSSACLSNEGQLRKWYSTSSVRERGQSSAGVNADPARWQRQSSAGVSADPARRRMRGQMDLKAKKRRKGKNRLDRIRATMPPPFFRGNNALALLSPRARLANALRIFDSSCLKDGRIPMQTLGWMIKYYPYFFNSIYHKIGGVGRVPGVEVGQCFSSRAQLIVAGLHRQVQKGIDWIEVTVNKLLLATCVVHSNKYEDTEDKGETLIYTGEGGNDGTSRKQTKDQTLEGGNLALYNSAVKGEPVRVIRRRTVARTSADSPSGDRFSYDGLYEVVDVLKGYGKSGFIVFKFCLDRKPNQAPLIWFPREQMPSRDQTRRRSSLSSGRVHHNVGKEGGSGQGNEFGKGQLL